MQASVNKYRKWMLLDNCWLVEDRWCKCAPLGALAHIKLALVLTTAAIFLGGWWEAKSRYWSMCVGFQYTDVGSKPSSSHWSRTSRKGKQWLSSSLCVNWIIGWRMDAIVTRGSYPPISLYSIHHQRVISRTLERGKSLCDVLHYRVHYHHWDGDPMAVPNTCL